MDNFSYNPNQPREPKGSSIGGQWARSGGSAIKPSDAKKGDMIRDVYGEWHEVYSNDEGIIKTKDGKRIHITKIAEARTSNEAVNINTLRKNDMIKDVYGQWHRVMEVRENAIYTYDGKIIHISKVLKKQAMSIPIESF